MSDQRVLQLYITSGTPHSEQALQRLRRALNKYPEDRYCLHIVDLRLEPIRALQDGIVAVPTLQLSSGSLRARLVGDLSETETLQHFLHALQ